MTKQRKEKEFAVSGDAANYLKIPYDFQNLILNKYNRSTERKREEEARRREVSGGQ